MAMRKKQLWFLVPLIMFLIIIGLFYTRLGKDTTVVTNTSLNRPLPNFILPSLANPEQTITQAQLPKQPYLLNICNVIDYTQELNKSFITRRLYPAAVQQI